MSKVVNKKRAGQRVSGLAVRGVEVLEGRQMFAGFQLDDGSGHSGGCPCGFCGNGNSKATDPALRYNANMVGPQEYQIATKWSSTATQGNIGGTQGVPVILTYSIVPDGTPIPGFNSEPAAPSNLRARFNGIYGGNFETWRLLIDQALNDWGQESGVTYIYEPADDGITLSSSGNNGILGVRGDVRISGHNIDGNSGILAYNFFPNVADMVIDTNDTFYNSTGSNSLRLRNVIAHEAGHGLGFNHTDPVNQTKLMEPFLSTNFDGVQYDDRLAASRNYGDYLEKNGRNDTFATATNLGALSDGTFTQTNVVVTSTLDADYFRFEVPAGADKISNITLAPQGPASYLQGPQGTAGTTFLPLSQGNLQLRVYNEAQVLIASSEVAATGGTEIVSNLDLAPGVYFARATISSGVTQAYNLSVNLSNPVTVAVTDIASPRTTPVTTAISFTFSEGVTGFDKTDILLMRDGFALDLSTASFATLNSTTYSLSGLTGFTDEAGTYTLTLLAAGSGIASSAFAKPLSTNYTDTFQNTQINGTNGADTISIVPSTTPGLADVLINALPAYQLETGALPNLTLSTLAGNDTITLGAGLNTPVIVTGAGDSDRLIIQANPAGGAVTLSGASVTGIGFDVSTTGVEELSFVGSDSDNQLTITGSPSLSLTSFAGGIGNDTLTVSAGNLMINSALIAGTSNLALQLRNNATATLGSILSLSTLDIEAGSAATVAAGGNNTLQVGAIVLGGLLNTTNNDLVLNYNGVTSLPILVTAVNDGRLVSDATAADGSTFLALGEAFDLGLVDFDGITVDDTTVIGKFTYAGDANFDGKVDSDDYGVVDATFGNSVQGAALGDLNYDGIVNEDDYGNIDATFGAGSTNPLSPFFYGPKPGAEAKNDGLDSALEALFANGKLFSQTPILG